MTIHNICFSRTKNELDKTLIIQNNLSILKNNNLLNDLNSTVEVLKSGLMCER